MTSRLAFASLRTRVRAGMAIAVFHALSLLCIILAACNNVNAGSTPLPLTPHETVRSYLENEDGHTLISKHLDLHLDVTYNPLVYFNRAAVPERFTNEKYGTRSLSDVVLLRELGYYIPGIVTSTLQFFHLKKPLFFWKNL